MTKNKAITQQDYWSIVKRQFSKNRLAVWSLRIVYLIIFIGLMADFIANDKPIYCKIKEVSYFPILKSYGVALGITKFPAELNIVDWHKIDYQTVWRTPIPYSPQYMDSKNSDYKSPFGSQEIISTRWRHILGTDALGRDVMSGMIHGTRTAMLVGVISMSITVLIGVLLGSMAGYYGDKGLQMSRAKFYFFIFFLILGIYYGFGIRSYHLSKALSLDMLSFSIQIIISVLIIIFSIILGNFLSSIASKWSFLGKKIDIPVDIIISRLIEIKVSIPTMLLILSIVAVIKSPSILIVMVIIGLTSWTSIAKYTRSEMLKVRNLEYIQAAQSMGFSEMRTIFRHALPNSISSVLVAVAFGIAGAILLESSLSFLGIGMKPEDVTWGSLLSSARSYSKAWWLAIFPGFAIFITVTIFNLLGEGLTDAMDPKLKK